MPRPTDSSDRTDSLPEPELNPLLNPVLAQHMGRWAEVYFTTPPEKRAEAVQELIRELESAPAAAPEMSAVRKSTPPAAISTETLPAMGSTRGVQSHSGPSVVPCQSCGAANTADQRFCGMCGVPLQPAETAGRGNHADFEHTNFSGKEFSTSDAAHTDLPRENLPHADLHREDIHRIDFRQVDFRQLDFPIPNAQPDSPPLTTTSAHPETVPVEPHYAAEQPGRILVPLELHENLPEATPAKPVRSADYGGDYGSAAYGDDNYDRELRSLRQSLAGSGAADDTESGSVLDHHRYRIYAGVVLAILVGILIYMGWRGTQAFSTQPFPPKINSTPAAAETAVPATPRTETASSPNSSGFAADGANSSTANSSQPNQTHTTQSGNARETVSSAQPAPMQPDIIPATGAGSEKATAQSPVQTTASLERIAAPVPARGNGSEELAIAQGYLDTKSGKTPDSGEAAKWLWKSVSKQNASAALLLSDLYVRGDGVPQSCDQARLLLDAAARKAVAGAVERIRNLQTKGCQ